MFVTYETSWALVSTRDKKKPLLLLRKKWNILRLEGSFRRCWRSPEICEYRGWTRGRPVSLIPWNHLPPVILLPESSVHLAFPTTYPPRPRSPLHLLPCYFRLSYFRAIQQSSANYCHRFFVNQPVSSRYQTISFSLARILFSMEFAQQLDHRCKKRIFPLIL